MIRATSLETINEGGAEINVARRGKEVVAIYNLPTEYTEKVLPDLLPPKSLITRLKEGIRLATSLVDKLPPLRFPNPPLL